MIPPYYIAFSIAMTKVKCNHHTLWVSYEVSIVNGFEKIDIL